MRMWERILHFLTLLFVVLSLVGAFFVPAHVRFILDDFLFPFGLIFLAITFFKNPKWRWLILAFGTIAAWGMISDVLANGTIRTAPIGLLLRWLKWPIILISIAELGQLKIRREHLENGVVVAFLVLAGMNILMMIDPFGVGEALSKTYTQKLEILLSNYNEFGAFRLSGTMRNPNTNAALFGLFLIFFLHLNARKYWKYILLAFVLIFLTQSRTVMIVTLPILGLYLLNKNSRKANLIIIPGGVLALFAGLFLFRSSNLISIFDGSAFQSNSWTIRLEHYVVLFESEMSELFFGHGIVLDPITSVGFYFDSEYLSIGYQYGFVGLVFWIIIIGLLLQLARKVDRKSTFGWAIVIFIFGVATTNFTFLNVECGILMTTLIGTWFFLQRDKELSHHSKEQAK